MSLRSEGGRVHLRALPAEKQRWELAAGGPGFLSKWLRDLANREALRSFPATHRLEPKAETEAMCPRWMYHREGIYCPGCDRVQ